MFMVFFASERLSLLKDSFVLVELLIEKNSKSISELSVSQLLKCFVPPTKCFENQVVISLDKFRGSCLNYVHENIFNANTLYVIEHWVSDLI